MTTTLGVRVLHCLAHWLRLNGCRVWSEWEGEPTDEPRTRLLVGHECATCGKRTLDYTCVYDGDRIEPIRRVIATRWARSRFVNDASTRPHAR